MISQYVCWVETLEEAKRMVSQCDGVSTTGFYKEIDGAYQVVIRSWSVE